MQSSLTRRQKSYVHRRAISAVEFVGFLAALIGGIVLGSIYLGVDVQAVAVDVLEKADIEVPSVLNFKASDVQEATDQASVEDNATERNAEETVATAQPAESTEDSSEGTSGQHESTDDGQPRPELSDAEKLVATQTCWDQLNQFVRGEADNRSKSIGDPADWQLFDYLLHRKDGHRKAVEAIEEIDLRGVEPRLAAHVTQVLAWHRAGERLFDRATQLLTDAPAGKLTGPFAQSWQSAATQHRMEEKLIANKHASVASYLQHANKISGASSN